MALKVFGYGTKLEWSERQRIAEEELHGWHSFDPRRYKGFLAPFGERAELIYVSRCDDPKRIYPAFEMEYVAGEPLEKWMGREGCDRGLLFPLFGKLLGYLIAFCQSHSHGDLHGNNILVTGSPKHRGDRFDLVVIDFHTVRSLQSTYRRDEINRSYWSGDPYAVKRNYEDVFVLGNVLEGLLRGDDPPPGYYVDAQGEKAPPPPEERAKRMRRARHYSKTPVEENLIRLVQDMTCNRDSRITLEVAQARFEAIEAEWEKSLGRKRMRRPAFAVAALVALAALSGFAAYRYLPSASLFGESAVEGTEAVGGQAGKPAVEVAEKNVKNAAPAESDAVEMNDKIVEPPGQDAPQPAIFQTNAEPLPQASSLIAQDAGTGKNPDGVAALGGGFQFYDDSVDEAYWLGLKDENLADAYDIYNAEGSFGLGIFEGGDVEMVNSLTWVFT